MRERWEPGPLSGPSGETGPEGCFSQSRPILEGPVFLDGSDILRHGEGCSGPWRGPRHSQHQGDMTEFTFLLWLHE